MPLRDYLAPESIRLGLTGTSPEEALVELVDTFGLPTDARSTVERLLRRREEIGSTGVGHGVAIPHTRCLIVDRLRLAYGHSAQGIEWHAIDGKPVHTLFTMVSPTVRAHLHLLSRLTYGLRLGEFRGPVTEQASRDALLAGARFVDVAARPASKEK